MTWKSSRVMNSIPLRLVLVLWPQPAYSLIQIKFTAHWLWNTSQDHIIIIILIKYFTVLYWGRPEVIYQIDREQSAQRQHSVLKLGRINKMLTAWRIAIIRIKTLVYETLCKAKEANDLWWNCMYDISKIVLWFSCTAAVITQTFHSRTRKGSSIIYS